jgi:hypothetical protein
VPARTGLHWVRQGIATFWRQPLALVGLFFLFMGCISLLSMIPVVGALLALGVTPAATLGLMVATRRAAQGQFPMPHVLLSAFKSPHTRLPMIQLGLIYGVSFLVVMGLSSFVDGGLLAQMYLGQGKPDTENIDLPALQSAMWLVMALYLPIALVFWHAPALVYWHGVGPVKSLFFSSLACWRNKGAMFMFAMGWMGVMVGISVVLGTLVSLLGGPEQGAYVVMPVLMAMAAMFFTSLDFSFLDSFFTDDPSATADNSSTTPPADL